MPYLSFGTLFILLRAAVEAAIPILLVIFLIKGIKYLNKKDKE